MRATLLPLLIAIFSYPAFSQYCNLGNRFTEMEYFSDSEIGSTLDVIYGSDTSWQGNIDTLRYDVYYPLASNDTLSSRPAVVIIHGGGFSGGDKSQWQRECRAFAKRGFVAFTISYRLGWDSQVPTNQINAIYRANQDARAALRHIVHNASTYQIDPNWLFLSGGSAGSITTLNTVYADQIEWNTFIPGIENRLGSLNSSANSLTDQFSIKGILNHWGSVFPQFVQVNEMIPTISFHGELDTTVPIDTSTGGLIGSRPIHNALLANGVCSDLTTQPDGGHGIYRNSEGVTFRVGRASCFFKSVICNNCVSFYNSSQVDATCSSALSNDAIISPDQITAYPNPFTGSFQLQGLSGLEQFTLANSIGATVYEGRDIADKSFTHLPSGIYFLTIQHKANTETIKLYKR